MSVLSSFLIQFPVFFQPDDYLTINSAFVSHLSQSPYLSLLSPQRGEELCDRQHEAEALHLPGGRRAQAGARARRHA